MRQLLLVLLLLSVVLPSSAQIDSVFIRQIFNEALSRGRAYEDLRGLCKDVGARLSGSSEAQMAIEWSKERMEGYGFDKVYLQEIMVPHWERGTKESGWIRDSKGRYTRLTCWR